MISSNLVGCSTGRSPAAGLRALSTLIDRRKPISCCQVNDLLSVRVEERRCQHVESFRAVTSGGRERTLEIARAANVEPEQLHAKLSCGSFGRGDIRLGGIGIVEHRDPANARQDLEKNLEPLGAQLRVQE